MIHLFGKVYLTTDCYVDNISDKVIISSNIGGLDSYEKFIEFTKASILINKKTLDEVIGPNGEFADFIDFFNFIYSEHIKTDKKITINVEEKYFYNVLFNWFKIILLNDSDSNVEKVCDLNIFYYKLFNEQQSVNPKVYVSRNVSVDIEKNYNTNVPTNKIQSFIAKIKNSLSVEYLISSYLYDGSCKSELKNKIQKLYIANLESGLFDLREYFIFNFMESSFASKMNLSKTYDLSNYNTIFEDNSKFVNALFKDKLWKTSAFRLPSSNGKNMIDIDNLKSEIVNALIEVVDAINDITAETGTSTTKKNLELFEIANNFTDDVLNRYIEAEKLNVNLEGLILTISISTINVYITKYVLAKHKENNLEEIKNFALK